jgi:hypothetical protein
MIGGFNIVPSQYTPYQHDFIRLPLVWGWASWRRTWEGYDPDMKDWAHLHKTDFLARITRGNRRLKTYLQTYFDRSAGLGPTYLDSWDFPLTYHLLKKGLLTAFPHTNLVGNLGLGHAAAVNTGASRLLPAPRPSLPNFPRRPSFILICWRRPTPPAPTGILPSIIGPISASKPIWLMGRCGKPLLPDDSGGGLFGSRWERAETTRHVQKRGFHTFTPHSFRPEEKGRVVFPFLLGEISGSGAMAGHHQPYLQPHCRPSRDLYPVVMPIFLKDIHRYSHPNHGIRP